MTTGNDNWLGQQVMTTGYAHGSGVKLCIKNRNDAGGCPNSLHNDFVTPTPPSQRPVNPSTLRTPTLAALLGLSLTEADCDIGTLLAYSRDGDEIESRFVTHRYP